MSNSLTNHISQPATLVLDDRIVRPQHAPGDWRVQVFQDRRGRSITKVIADGCHICTVDYTAARTALGQLCPEYLDGNALLIAASPGLLRSLLELLPMLADFHDDPRVARAKLRVAQAVGREGVTP